MSDGYIEIDDDEDDFDDDLVIGDTSSGSDGINFFLFTLSDVKNFEKIYNLVKLKFSYKVTPLPRCKS